MNRYYEMFINDNVSNDILKVNPNSLSYEDHFWHYCCLSLYYKNKKDYYMHKQCLSASCDLNYFYNAMIYFDAFKVLPQNFNKYIKNFEHKMKNDKLEQLIDEANKRDKKKQRMGFLWYSLASVLVIPIMLLLVFVFKMDTMVAAIAAIVFLFVSQTILSPIMKQRKELKNAKRNSELSKDERAFFNYLLQFSNLVYSEKYVAMIKADTDEERNIIINCIKTNKPLPEEIKDKKKAKKIKNKENKNS